MILAFLNGVFEIVQLVPAVIAVGNQPLGIRIQVFRSGVNLIGAPPNAPDSLHNDAGGTVISVPEIERGGAFAV